MKDPYGYYDSSASKQDVKLLMSSFVCLCEVLLEDKVISKKSYNKILKELVDVIPRVSRSKEI